MALYRRYHAFQTAAKDWPSHDGYGSDAYRDSFVDNPFPTEEWRYYREQKLIGIGYVDALADGLSAIYFYYEPEERSLSLGTWNILSLVEEAAARNLDYVYLGYFVADCASMAYKARFRPHELLQGDGRWRPGK
jgi:arginine-tRNA-protein transferase